MAFKPNYRRDRLDRDRAARARSEEKQRKKDERTAQRKAEQAASEGPSEDQQDWLAGIWPAISLLSAYLYGRCQRARRVGWRWRLIDSISVKVSVTGRPHAARMLHAAHTK